MCQNFEEMHRGTPCYSRELQLNGVFFISAVGVKVLVYPVGAALDFYGPRLTSMFGCIIFAVGCAMLAASDLSLGWLHYIGYCVMTAGGVCVYVPSLQLCRILPKLSGVMMAMMTSAFDMSAVIFVVLGRIRDATGGKFTIHRILAAYTAVPAIAFILVTSFYPDGVIPIAPRRRQKPEWKTNKPDLAAPRRLRDIAMTLEFWLTAIFTGVMTSRFTYFLATLNIRLARTGLSWSFQRSALMGFTTFFPLGGFISMTAVGQLLHSFSLATNILLLWIAVNLFWEPLLAIRSRDMQALSIVLCAILRPYYYSVTNQLCERLFGQNRLGRVYGLVMAVAALINLTTIYAVYEAYHMRTWAIVQAWRAVRLGARMGIILPLYLYYRRL